MERRATAKYYFVRLIKNEMVLNIKGHITKAVKGAGDAWKSVVERAGFSEVGRVMMDVAYLPLAIQVSTALLTHVKSGTKVRKDKWGNSTLSAIGGVGSVTRNVFLKLLDHLFLGFKMRNANLFKLVDGTDICVWLLVIRNAYGTKIPPKDMYVILYGFALSKLILVLMEHVISLKKLGGDYHNVLHKSVMQWMYGVLLATAAFGTFWKMAQTEEHAGGRWAARSNAETVISQKYVVWGTVMHALTAATKSAMNQTSREEHTPKRATYTAITADDLENKLKNDIKKIT